MCAFSIDGRKKAVLGFFMYVWYGKGRDAMRCGADQVVVILFRCHPFLVVPMFAFLFLLVVIIVVFLIFLIARVYFR